MLMQAKEGNANLTSKGSALPHGGQDLLLLLLIGIIVALLELKISFVKKEIAVILSFDATRRRGLEVRLVITKSSETIF